jgi:formyl-CoA transferase
LAAVVGVHAFQGARWTVAGEVARAQGNHHPSIAPYGAFTASDGIVQIAVGSEQLWHRFAPLIGLDPADPRFATNADRVSHREALIEIVDTALQAAPSAHWLPLLEQAGIPAGRVRTLDQVFNWDQTRSQGLIIEVDQATLGPVRLPGPPLRFESHPSATHRPPPTLGQHNESVRAWLDDPAGSSSTN